MQDITLGQPGNGDPQSRTVGSLVPTGEGVQFHPDAAPEDFVEKPEPSLGQRMKATWRRMTGRAPNEPEANRLLEEGRQLFDQGKYAEASKNFSRAAVIWPDSTLEEEATFRLGECYFFTDRYSKANDTYTNLLKKFENSRFLDVAVSRQFAIARYWDQVEQKDPRWALSPNFFDKTRPMFDTRGNAVATYEGVHLSDPTGPLADDSVLAIANMHYLSEDFDDADVYYTTLRRDYPNSDFQFQSHLLGLSSKLRKYQGSFYDGTPLDEAEQLANHTLEQFPDFPGDERERVRRTLDIVMDQRAQRDWDMGEYYNKKEHYRAARYYYQQVLDQHGDSRFASLATQRLASIQSLPDSPAEKFTWLANLFPGERRKSQARLDNELPSTSRTRMASQPPASGTPPQ